MMEENKNTITIMGEDNKEITCEVLFTFDSEQTHKSYIAYTDNTTDESGSVKVYASIYDPTGADKSLKPITTEEEWTIIENILASVQEKIDAEDSIA